MELGEILRWLGIYVTVFGLIIWFWGIERRLNRMLTDLNEIRTDIATLDFVLEKESQQFLRSLTESKE